MTMKKEDLLSLVSLLERAELIIIVTAGVRTALGPDIKAEIIQALQERADKQ